MAGTWNQWEGHVIDGRFKLVQYLGGSDHSAVFLTQRGEQKAAIKLVAAEPQRAEPQLARWAAAAKLSHPRLIALYERGRCELGDAQLLYLVMEYAEENLSQVVPQRALTSREAREMLSPLLEALTYLHTQGFANAGLKPSNIMAVGEQLKLAGDDARAFADARHEPQIDGGGSDAYDPPEAGHGQLSAAWDVWSLGMTLVEVLTQRRLERKKLMLAPEPGVPLAVPAPFLEIARHCLQREPGRRCTVVEIAARLEKSAPEVTIATPGAEAPPAAPFEVRTPRYWIPVAAAGLIVAAFVVLPRLGTRRSEPESVQGSATEQPAPQPSETPAPARRAASDDNKRSEGKVASSLPAPASPAPSSSPAANAPGAVLEKVLPHVPQSARDTIEGRIRVHVKVEVDPSGKVEKATLESPGPSQYFARLALEASRHWKFDPPRVKGQAVASTWMLRYQFKNTATEVYPAQTSP